MLPERSLQEILTGEIRSRDLTLPVFHNVALDVRRLVESGACSAGDVEKVIAQDPALAGQVLRVANSPFFSGLSKVSTVEKAIVRLGLKQVSSIVLLASQKGAYKSKVALIERYMEDLWKQANASSVGTKWVATRSGHRGVAEEAFLAGLLHDIGKLVILKLLEQMIDEQGEAHGISDSIVVEVLRGMHEEQGGILLEEWNFPDEYVEVARNHHSDKVERGNTVLLAVRLVDCVIGKLGIGCEPIKDAAPESTLEAEMLGLSEIQIAELEILLEDQMDLV